MKHTIVIILLITNSLCATAQKNNTFADVGINDLTHFPGVSVTYNRQLVKYFGIGIGAQEYNNELSGSSLVTPTIYADLRGYLPVHKSLFFMLADFGMDIYSSDGTNIHEDPHNNGFYTGLGIGYCYRINKKGMGPYLSFKMISDSYTSKKYDPVTQQVYTGTNNNGSLVIAVGFKF
jgi:hypothetical protein